MQLMRVEIAELMRSGKWPAKLQFTPQQMARLAKKGNRPARAR
jgi:hypothetical protein